MKKLTALLFLIASFSITTQAAPMSWVSELDKTVLIAANPKLTVKLLKVAIDDQTYGQLEIELNYSSAETAQQMNDVMKAYPGYMAQRIVIRKNGLYHYEIPLLNVSQDIDPKPGMEGPYVNDVRYVTKAQYQTLTSSIANQQAVVKFNGTLLGTVPMTKVAEHKEVSPSICARILARNASVGSLMTLLTSVSGDQLGIGAFQFDSTRSALLKDVRETCFDLAQPARIASFTDLMTVSLKPKLLSRNLVGETVQKTFEQTAVQLSYSVDQAVIQ